MIVASGLLIRPTVKGVHLVISRLIHVSATDRGERENEDEQQEKGAGQGGCCGLAGGFAEDHHILMKRVTPRINASTDAVTIKAKLPRMRYSQMVEMMVKMDGMRASSL